jgi:DNA-binding IclR family transcriptional regulator
MIDIMRNLHGTYAPADEPFGSRLEISFIGLCVAIGDIEGKPFSVSKIAAYMNVSRTTVLRRLDTLHKWGLVKRRGRSYYMEERLLNSLIGMRCYKRVRHLISRASDEMAALDTETLKICQL